MNIYDKLKKYSQKKIYPMHMPGHKRNPEFSMCNPYAIDVTEVEGMDNLHHPKEMIRDLMGQMKRKYRTKDSFVLINGSTCGLLAAISACCQPGDTIIMDRNCHKAVYHAVYLLQLNPVYLYPQVEAGTGIATGIQPQCVKTVIAQNERASCVVLTSPTYEGVVSDIRTIAELSHKQNIPLIVDEAHGAHFAWEKRLPETAMEQGADLVIESIHKTLPAFTQTAVLHRCTTRVSRERIERYLDIYETSSPSYILLAGASQCMTWMEKNASLAFEQYFENLAWFHGQAKDWKTLSLWQHERQEPSKLVIMTGTSSLTGHELAEQLRSRFSIEVEMDTMNYVLAMTSLCDTREGFERLATALTQIDCEIHEKAAEPMEIDTAATGEVVSQMGIYEAMNHRFEQTMRRESEDKVAAEYAYIYPPGIPFLVPGEVITEAVIKKIERAKQAGLELLGLADETGETIRTVVQGGKNG